MSDFEKAMKVVRTGVNWGVKLGTGVTVGGAMTAFIPRNANVIIKTSGFLSAIAATSLVSRELAKEADRFFDGIESETDN